jgi:CHASE1-domain containing sensor protein/tRNA A-37 threonylcarbamoyl transferase component Bud32
MPETTLSTRPHVAHAAALLGRKTAVLVFVAGVAASIAVFFVLRGLSLADARAAIDARGEQIVRAIEAKIALPLQALEAVVAYRRVTTPDRASFRVFASLLLERHPSLAALEFAEVVRHDQRLEVEARLSRDVGRPTRIRHPDAAGRMVPSPDRDAYTVLTSLEPWLDDVIGLDVGFEPERAASLDHAASHGERYCSSRIRLVEDPPDVYSVVVYEPEYEGGRVPSDPIARRRAVRGYAIALFRLDPLMKQALAGLDIEGIQIVVSDETEREGAESVSAQGDERSLIYPTRAVAPIGDHAVVHALIFAGRTWNVSIRSELSASGTPWVALALGIGLSLFVAVAFGAMAEARRFRGAMREMKRLGQYEVTRLIAAGGMGRVYEASHGLLRRRTAIKVVSHDIAGEDTLKRFEREVRAMSLLTHPSTVVVYDYGRSEQGHFYYAMEYIEGPNFDELVRLEGRLEPARVKYLLLQVVGALAEAHGQGFVHRDVKPANIMATMRGGRYDFVKVLDFGLVRDLHAKESRLTSTGSISGTPGFVPPEAFEGHESVSPATDVYAVGCVAYWMLTGSEVFEGAVASEIVAAHLGSTPEAPSARFGVDARMDAFILKCLAKDPRDRYADGKALEAALGALDLGEWPQAAAEASWRRWQNARAALAPDEVHARDADISHIDVAFGAARVEDRRAYLPTQSGSHR